ncbi:hypothetical protein [Hyphococcus sp.]|uniref:hypothetical protein n=1 Tax=Hyphococcus sp. TaxID=2038636 RepID=UPI003CCBB732
MTEEYGIDSELERALHASSFLKVKEFAKKKKYSLIKLEKSEERNCLKANEDFDLFQLFLPPTSEKNVALILEIYVLADDIQMIQFRHLRRGI